MEPTLAEIRLFAGNFAPRGWAFCHGQILPINSNQSLFSLLGTMYGGDGRTSFALPDLRGRVPVSAGQSPGYSEWKQGEKRGSESNNLSLNQMPAHNHRITVSAKIKATAQVGHNPSPENNIPAESKEEPGDTMYAANPSNQACDTDPNAVCMGGGGSISGLNLANTGSNQPINNKAPVLGLNYIIAIQGLFPSRN